MKRSNRLLLVWVVCSGAALLVPAVSATHELPAPVAHWKLDETSGTTAFDETANNNDGTLCGDNALCTPPGGPTVNQPGHFGTAYSFDGTNDCIQIPDSTSLDITTSISLSGWLNVAVAQTHIIVSKGNDAVANGRTPYRIQTDSTGLPTFVIGQTPTQTVLKGPTAIPLSQFVHIAGTYDGTQMRVYVNGESVASAALTGAIVPSNNLATIGSLIGSVTPTCNSFTNGRIDEVRIYNQALEPWMIEDLFLDPEHHPCTSSTTSFTLNVGPSMVTVVMMFAVAAVLVLGLMFKIKRGFHAFYAIAAIGLLAVSVPEPVSATNVCSYTTGSAIADSFAIPLFWIAILSAVVLIVVYAVRKTTGGPGY